MKYIFAFMLGIGVWCWVGSSFEAEISVHYIQADRNVVVIESPQPDGMTKKVVYEIYTDRIFRATISNEVIYATNTIDTGTAIIKIEPVDERRAH